MTLILKHWLFPTSVLRQEFGRLKNSLENWSYLPWQSSGTVIVWKNPGSSDDQTFSFVTIGEVILCLPYVITCHGFYFSSPPDFFSCRNGRSSYVGEVVIIIIFVISDSIVSGSDITWFFFIVHTAVPYSVVPNDNIF